MRLSKAQVDAITDTFIRPMRKAINDEKEKRASAHWIRWMKTSDGKAWSKLPQWMKDEIPDYRIERSDSFKSVEDKSPTKELPTLAEISDFVILSAIDAKHVGDIHKALKKAFG